MKLSDLRTKDGQSVWPEEKETKASYEKGALTSHVFENHAYNAALSDADVEIEVDQLELSDLILAFYENECLDDAMNIPRLAQHISKTMSLWLRAKGKEQ